MKIECKLNRDGGTFVTFDGDEGSVEYHFKAGADGKYVADIADAAHARQLLAQLPPVYVAADAAAQTLVESLPKPQTQDFVDPAVANKGYSTAQLEAMHYQAVKKYAQERFGLALAVNANKAAWITAILNAQGE